MTSTQLRPPRMRRQAMAMRMVNVPMRRILRLPFRTPLSKNLMLLYLTGRRTGKAYRQPVSYVRYGDSLLTPRRREVEAQPGTGAPRTNPARRA